MSTPQHGEMREGRGLFTCGHPFPALLRPWPDHARELGHWSCAASVLWHRHGLPVDPHTRPLRVFPALLLACPLVPALALGAAPMIAGASPRSRPGRSNSNTAKASRRPRLPLHRPRLLPQRAIARPCPCRVARWRALTGAPLAARLTALEAQAREADSASPPWRPTPRAPSPPHRRPRATATSGRQGKSPSPAFRARAAIPRFPSPTSTRWPAKQRSGRSTIPRFRAM
jgi:hypothetical protein